MIRSVRLGQKVQRLISLAERLQPTANALTNSCYQLLDSDSGSEDFITGASCLNNDGSPLQLCITTSGKGASLRVIGDPGSFHTTIESRYQSSIKTLRHAINSSGSSDLKEIAEKTIEMLLPKHKDERNIYKQGFVWIGTSPQQAGIAFYLEMAPLSQEKGWNTVTTWLKEILPSANDAITIINKLKEHCVVASAGLEGSTLENSRAKIYFRMRETTDFQHLGIELFSSQEMKDFLSIATEKYKTDLNGLVMSVGFNLQTGAHADVKADLCGHCLRYTTSEWQSIINRLTSRFSITPVDTGIMLDSQEYQIAFIGFGLTLDLKPRLNIYLKHDAQKGMPESDEIWGALKDSMRYLISIQNDNGSWDDYHLPVGTSDQWVTAYAAHALAQYGKKSGNNEAVDAATKAANWLSVQRSYNSGWGFNARTGPDADSTAMAVALFDELGLPVEAADRLFFREHWLEDDGIATYTEPDAWATGHWDVTPWGYHGMSMEDQTTFFDPFQKALHTHRMDNGFWRSYWWRNPYYSTFITLEVLDRLGLQEPMDAYEYDASSVQIDNAFDLACYIGIECIRGYADEKIGSHLRTLLNWQAENGQWYGSANLRVTDNFCYEPWNNPSGTYYEDNKSTITTATIMRVLSKIIPTKAPHNSSVIYNWM
jgi:hypothetical protein